MDPLALGGRGFDLLRVDHTRNTQSALVRQIVEACERVVEETVAREKGADAQQVRAMGGQITSLNLQMAAALFKDDAFADEREWRFVTRQLWLNEEMLETTEAVGGPTNYRCSGGRVVAFEELDISTRSAQAAQQDSKVRIEAVREIVLGYSCPMRDEDRSLELLLLNRIGRVPVTRSRVLVRP